MTPTFRTEITIFTLEVLLHWPSQRIHLLRADPDTYSTRFRLGRANLFPQGLLRLFLPSYGS